MNFILISDIHVTSRNPIGRKGNILQSFKNKFIFILEYAQKHNAIILQAGDFFEKSRDWHVLYLISNLIKKYNVPVYTIYGQHDLYMRANPDTTPTTIGLLNKFGMVNILNNKKPTILDKTYVYGCSWNNKISQPKPGKKNILVIHAPITTKELFPGHNFTAVSNFICKNKGWDLILAGDIHAKTIYKFKKTILVNTGPMLRLASTKYNFKHKPCFFLYNTKSHRVKEIIIPHEDAKLVLSRSHIIKKQVTTKMLPATTLKQFAKLLKQKSASQLPLKKILEDLIKKHNAPKKVKRYLLKVMDNGEWRKS